MEDAAREVVAAGAVAGVSERAIEGLVDVLIVVVEDVDEVLVDIVRVFYGDLFKVLMVIVLMGSVGKMMMLYFVKVVFEEADIRMGFVGSNGNYVGDEFKFMV